MELERKNYKQSFIGNLFGKMGLKNMLKDEPIIKNLPTVPSLKIKEQINFTEEKTNWM